jgi:hypothetical protein
MTCGLVPTRHVPRTPILPSLRGAPRRRFFCEVPCGRACQLFLGDETDTARAERKIRRPNSSFSRVNVPHFATGTHWRLLRAHGARRARVSFPAVPRDSQRRSDTCKCADAKRTGAVERHPSAANAHRHFRTRGKDRKDCKIRPFLLALQRDGIFPQIFPDLSDGQIGCPLKCAAPPPHGRTRWTIPP